MKYNITPQGLKHGYRSGLEETIAKQIEDAGLLVEFEASVIDYIKPQSSHKYTPDFDLEKSDGVVMYIETKGRLMLEDRKKHILINKQHPRLDIRFVFQNPRARISKTSKTTYADWANNNYFKWAAKTIPQEWLDECR